MDPDIERLLVDPLTLQVGMTHHLHVYQKRHLLVRSLIGKFLTITGRPVVDVGCGLGTTLWLLKDLGFSELVGIDIFYQKADTYLADVTNARIIHADLELIEPLPGLADNSCDCVVSSQVLEHLFNFPFHHLQECFRILRPGGLFLLDIPNSNTLANALRMIRGQFGIWGDRDFGMNRKIQSDGTLYTTWSLHYREYPQPVLQEMVRQLPGSRILSSGFVSTSGSPTVGFGKRLARRCLEMTGVTDHRLVANVQWLAITKEI